MNSAIATKLNVLESAIVRIEEWAHVLFVVVKGLGARFVSKKVVEKKMETVLSIGAMEAIGNRWQKNGMDRIYFEVASLVSGLSNSKKRKIAGAKLYFDVDDHGFYDSINDSSIAKEAIASIRESCSVTQTVSTPCVSDNAKPYPGAMMTSTGDWVSAEEWDDIEGDM